MIGYHFGMHEARVLLIALLLQLALMLVMRVLSDGRMSQRQYQCARDYGKNVLSHFVWL